VEFHDLFSTESGRYRLAMIYGERIFEIRVAIPEIKASKDKKCANFAWRPTKQQHARIQNITKQSKSILEGS